MPENGGGCQHDLRMPNRVTRERGGEAPQLTIDRLIPGDRYRVIRTIDELREGMIVRYIGINDIDNHYGIAEFEGPDGQTLGVRGDYSTLRASPLGGAYRYLEALDD